MPEENKQISTITDDTGLMSGNGPGEMAVITSITFSYSVN